MEFVLLAGAVLLLVFMLSASSFMNKQREANRGVAASLQSLGSTNSGDFPHCCHL